jgi:hypothetical protein
MPGSSAPYRRPRPSVPRQRPHLAPSPRSPCCVCVCPSSYRRTARIYARLGDGAASVRYNTLMVLTHLILNDMVKVKGQVTHRATHFQPLCVDPFLRARRALSLTPLPVSSRLRASCRMYHAVSTMPCVS